MNHVFVQAHARVGNIISDVGDVVSSAVDDVGSAISDIPVVGGALSDLGGDFQDFAKTDFGHGFLVAITTYVTGGLQNALIPLIGPIGAQVGTVAFAFPGLAAGENFGAAWTQEFVSRTEQLVQIAGTQVAQQFIAQYGPELASKFNDLAAQAGFSPDQISDYANTLQDASSQEIQNLANAAGVRADVLQSMIDYVSGKLNINISALLPWAQLSAAEQQAITTGYQGLALASDAASAQALYETNRLAEAGKRAFDPLTGNIQMTTTQISTANLHPSNILTVATQAKPVALQGLGHMANAPVAANHAAAVATATGNPAPAAAQAAAAAATPAASVVNPVVKDALVGGGALLVLGAIAKLFFL